MDCLNVEQSEKIVIQQNLDQIEESLHIYISHLVRGKYQRCQFLSQINNLKKGETIIVVDYITA